MATAQRAGHTQQQTQVQKEPGVAGCRARLQANLSLATTDSGIWGETGPLPGLGKTGPLQAPSAPYEQMGFAWADKRLKQQLCWASRGGEERWGKLARA